MKTPNFILTVKLRCTDGVVGDLRDFGIQRWWTVARDSHGRGYEVLQEAEVHSTYSVSDNTAAAADDDINDV